MRRLLALGAVGTVLALVLLTVLAGVVDQRRAEALTPAHTGEALAALEVVETVVEVRPGGVDDWMAAEDGRALEAGTGVRTDADGFAQIVYADGSQARLAEATTYEVVELAGDALAPIVRARLDVGRTWHRVQGVTGRRGGYEVETAVGTAAVRGTVFTIECDERPVCTFAVIEGTIVVTTPEGLVIVVNRDEEVTLGAAGEAAPAGGGAGGAPPGPGGPDDGGEPATPSSGSSDPASVGDPGTDDAGAGDTASAAVVELAREELSAGALAVRPWAATNLALDRETDRYGTLEESCSVTINGRNADLADTPDTAIDVDVADTVVIDALATGPLDTYAVSLGFGAASVPAASGTVLPDDDGDTSRFRGTADVSAYATWGVGLYEVEASTTGTVCVTRAFVHVSGPPPVVTVPSIAAVLVMVAALATIGSSLSDVLAAPTSTFGLLK